MRRLYQPGWRCSFLSVLFWLGAVGLAAAQRPDWQWVSNAQAPDGVQGAAIVRGTSTDLAGNAVVTGYYFGRVTFGQVVLDNGGNWQDGPYTAFVARLDADGQWLWATDARSVAPQAVASGCAVALDPISGETYVTGYYAQPTSFGDTTLNASAQGQGFVARLDAAGRWRWVQTAGAAGSDAEARALTLDPLTGDALVTGLLDRSTIFGATQLPSNGFQVFVARITAQGQWRWATAAGSGSYPSTLTRCIALNPTGNVVVGGEYPGWAVFGSDTLRAFANPSAGFVASLDGITGAWRWVRNAACLATGVAAAPGGDVFVTGIYGSDWPLIGDSALGAAGSRFFSAPYVACLSPQGHTRWVSPLRGQTARIVPGQLALEQGAGVLVTVGRYTGDSVVIAGHQLPATVNPNLFVARLSMDGQWLNVITAGGRETNVGDVASSFSPGTDYLTLTGGYVTSCTIGDQVLTHINSAPGYNPALFVARLSLGLAPVGGLALLPNPVAVSSETGARIVRAGNATPAATADVYDTTGCLILAVPFAAGTTGVPLPVQLLRAGLYVVRVGAASCRLVVQ